MSRLLKNPKLNVGPISAVSISGPAGAPLQLTGLVNLPNIANIKVSGALANSIVYTDSVGNLQFGTFASISALPAFAASNLLLGSSVVNTIGAVQLTSDTSVTDAIIQLNQQISLSAPKFRRFAFNTSMEWLIVHNMNTTQFFEVLTDSAGNRFNASINIIDTNSFRVSMTSAIAGFVDVNFVVS